MPNQKTKGQREEIISYFKDLVQLLFFEHSVFQVDGDLLLLARCARNVDVTVIVEFSWAKSVQVVESVDHLHASVVVKLTVHEQLRILATLCSKFDLSMVKWLKTSRQL